MRATQFSGGKWRVVFDTEITTSPIGISRGSEHVAEVKNTLMSPEEHAANLKLILNAPHLFRKLEEAAQMLSTSEVPNFKRLAHECNTLLDLISAPTV